MRATATHAISAIIRHAALDYARYSFEAHAEVMREILCARCRDARDRVCDALIDEAMSMRRVDAHVF